MYYECFVVVLILSFTPLKAISYVLPWFVTIRLWGVGVVASKSLLMLLGASLMGGIIYLVVESEFLLLNYLVALLTYSSWVPILLVDARLVASRNLLGRMVLASSTMVVIQGSVGIAQAIYGAIQTGSFSGANGDYVAGTIYPYFGAERAFSNPMFAVNMALLLMACMAIPEGSAGAKRASYVSVGLVSLVLASVVHALVFLIAGLIVAALLTAGRQTGQLTGYGRLRLASVILVVGVLSYVALPDNVKNIGAVAERALDLEAVNIPRAVMLSRVLSELPGDAPAQPYVGLGPGQFSSRASLIMSGVYFGGPDNPKSLPFVAAQSTRLTSDYCIDLMVTASGLDPDGQIGSSQQPFFSWLSVYTELGVAGVLGILLTVGGVLIRVRRAVRTRPKMRLLALFLIAGSVLLFLLGWQENYWETPQAIFVGLLLLKIMYANVVHVKSPASAVGDSACGAGAVAHSETPGVERRSEA